MRPTPRPPSRHPLARCGLLALLAATLAVGGCARDDRTIATSAIAVDYHQRHPIALENRRRTLDVFLAANGGRLDERQRKDVEAFAADFRVHGQSRIRVLVPRGGVDARPVDATLLAIRRTLAAAGVTGAIEVGSYAVADTRRASVLRMSYVEIEAVGAHRCGEWPDDLGSGPEFDSSDNRPWYNLGCANQATLAAQVDDPRDLVRPRPQAPSDVLIRTRSIGNLRGQPILGSKDPGTEWTQSNLAPIGRGN